MLSTVSVTSGIIFSAAESKLTSLIGMTIFKNCLQFIIGKDETFRAIISAARNFQVITSCQGGRRFEGRCFIIVLRIISITNLRIYYTGADIYGLHSQGDGAKIKDTPLLNILTGGVYIHVSVQKIV